MDEPTEVYLDPSNDSVRRLFERGIDGPLVMLNLIRLRHQADYSAHPELAPPEPISGRAAYDRYIAHTLPFLRATGGSLDYLGEGGPYLVGPAEHGWDLVMLVRQASVQSFLAFATNTEYLAGLGHRVAAVRDSRILPLVDVPV